MPSLVDSDAPTRPHLQIDPRIRERLVTVRREAGRKRLRLLVGLVTAVAFLGLGLAVLESPLAKVRHLRIAGGGGLPASVVINTAGLDHQRLMVDVEGRADAVRLEALAAVATAKVEREWPSTVKVTLTLRTPVALIPVRVGLASLDRTGRILAMGADAPAGLPVLQIKVAAGRVGSWIPGAAGRGDAALSSTAEIASGALPPAPVAIAEELALASALPPNLTARVNSEAVTPADGLVAIVGSTTVVLGDPSELATKVNSLLTLVSNAALAGVARVDLRVPDRPALTPASPGRS